MFRCCAGVIPGSTGPKAQPGLEVCACRNASPPRKVRFLLPRQHRQTGPLWPGSRCTEGGGAAAPQAGVIGKPHPVYGEQVVAFVTLREGQTAGEEQLIEFARKRLADYKTPERVVFLADLPKGPTGKVQRRALKQIAI